MIQKTDFQRVRRCFLAKHNQMFVRNDDAASPLARGMICETLIEGLVRADYDFSQVPKKQLFRVFYLLTKCMRYSELQMYRLMSKYANDDSIVSALERDDMRFFVNLFDIVSMGWRHDDDVCAFLYRDWHDGSTVRISGSGNRIF